MSETLLRQDETPALSYRSLDEGLAAAETARGGGDSIAALRTFAELREQFPDHAAAYLRAAAMLLQLRRFDEAEQLLANGAARFRDDPGFAIERGWLAYRRGHLDDAIERWREIREAMPGHHVGYTAGAMALRDAGRIAEAEELLAEAIERFPTDPGPRTDLRTISYLAVWDVNWTADNRLSWFALMTDGTQVNFFTPVTPEAIEKFGRPGAADS